nr:FABP1 [Batillipes sp.]
MVNFEGKYKLEKSENFEEYMKAVGVGMVMRKLGANAKPEMVIVRDGDKFTFTTKTTFKTTVLSFELGKEFAENTFDGREVNSVVTQNANKLIQVQKKDDFESIIEREFDENGLTTVCKCKDVVSTRRYKRIEN